jgi:hypothetical protein
VRVREHWFWFCAIGVLVYLISLIVLSKRSNVLKDNGIDASAVGVLSHSQLLPYSLGRFQMAFWFSLVIASFLFIWLITGAYDIISTTILSLIGISTATALSSSVIDTNKDQSILNQTVSLKEEENKLSLEIIALRQLIGNNAANQIELIGNLSTKEARQAQVRLEIAKNITVLTPKKSDGFFQDILSDENGVSFHRLQMFTWTIILGILFVFSVWTRLSMPEFSTTLLALQGLTAGTYLGFKIPEK